MPVPLRRLFWPGVVVVAALGAFALLRHERDTLVDFEVYRTAAERALDAEPLYRPSDGHYQYKYLPVFALAMAPFSLSTKAVTEAIWYALNVGLLALFFRMSVAALPDRRVSQQRLIWIGILLTGKFWVKELAFGQTNLLLGILLLTAMLAVTRRRLLVAGVLTGLAVFVKPYALVLLPWLALEAGAAGLAVFIGVLAAGLMLPATVYGWTGNLDLIVAWYHTVTDTTSPNLLSAENVSLAAMWAKWLASGPLASTLAVATAGALWILAALVRRRRAAVSQPAYLEFALLMLFMPLLSPQGWDYLLLIALPAYLCLVDRWHALSGPWRVLSAAGIYLTSFSIFDVMGRTVYTQVMLAAGVSVGVLLMIAALARLRWKALA